MKYRLAAIDLDGTLLNSSKRVSPRSVESIRRISGNGLMVVICTGRMIRSAQQYWDALGLDTPIIGYNGAHVKDMIKQEDILLRPLRADVTCDLIGFCRQRGIVPLTYSDDRLFVERDCEEVRRYSHAYNVEYQVIEDLPQHLSNGSTKLLISCEPSDCSRLAGEVRDRFGERVNVTQSEGRHVEVNDPSATKASALEFLAKRLGVGREEIVAFGDGINDAEMLKYVGWGVAVSNGWEEAKRASDQIIGSNDEDAVAVFLDSQSV